MSRRIISTAGLTMVVLLGASALAAQDASPPRSGPVSVSLEVIGWTAYLKQDLSLKLQFKNRAEPVVYIDTNAFSAASFSVRKPGGNRIKPAGETTGSPTEPIKVDGYDSIERVVNLSEAFPGLTSRKKTWDIGWTNGTWVADPIRVKVVESYNPLRDRAVVVETDIGRMTWTLLPEHAPRHVQRFVDLVREGYYDGLTFFRLIPGLQVEGGDPAGDGSGGWRRQTMGEFSDEVAVQAGLVAAARQETSMTSDSMFFITLGSLDYMRGKHTFYARITEGLELLAKMSRMENRGDNGLKDAFMLVPPVKIRRVTIRK